ncbi:nuclear transport factor 2 family protein [Halobacteriales archaeon Cl-PHB]
MASDERLERLAQRVSELEDREAIRDLRYRYSYLVDAHEWDAFLSLFTDDARIRFPQESLDRETYRGTDELEAFCDFLAESRPFMSHMMHNGRLEVAGDDATGTWYFEVPEVLDDGSTVWVQGRYEEDYRREGDDWKIAAVDIYFNYAADYADGLGDGLVAE